MNRRLSPDELDLAREELSAEDWKANLERLDNHPEAALAILEKGLSKAQKNVLERHYDRPDVHSGRGGYNVTTMRALEKLGLVKFLKKHVWEINWRLTPLGINVGRTLRQQTQKNAEKK
jgi:hypothetical protein